MAHVVEEYLGRYRLIKPLGMGGAGAVYKAKDTQLGRVVAVKSLLANNVDSQRRLVREAHAIAKVEHRNVAKVYDVGEHDGRPFLVLEFVDGVSLDNYVKGKSAKEILRVFVEAGKGLVAIHRAGLMHRDFKPENVIVSKKGIPKLVDFGLARGVEVKDEWDTDVTRAGRVLGTPVYMAPEQHKGETLDSRADQYGFCVALYEALAGSPFRKDLDPVSLLRAKRDGPKPVPAKVSNRVKSALAKGLSYRAKDRYPEMRQLVRELKPFWARLFGG